MPSTTRSSNPTGHPSVWTHEAGPQADWHSQNIEDVLEPELPIIDAHHHLFMRGEPMKHWIQHHERGIPPKYFTEELSADVNSGHKVIATVYSESGIFPESNPLHRIDGEEHHRCVGESEVVQGVAHLANRALYGPCRLCAGIISTADLSAGPRVMEPVFKAHLEAAPNFRGIRYKGGRAEEIPFTSDAFIGSVRLAASMGLVLDINGAEIFPLDFEKVLGGIVHLAREVPEATIVVNNCGGAIGPATFDADGGKEKLQLWQSLMQNLATCPGIIVKIGGCTRSQCGFKFDERRVPVSSEELCTALLPYYGFVLDTFGPARCMFVSDFPMDKVSCSYRTLWNMFKRIAEAKTLPQVDKHQVFQGTADRVYNLKVIGDEVQELISGAGLHWFQSP